MFTEESTVEQLILDTLTGNIKLKNCAK